MQFIGQGIAEALRLIGGLDTEFLQIVRTSIAVAACSTSIAALLGIPFGIVVAHGRFPGRRLVMTVLHTLMSLPTVVVGLLVYSMLSYQGPFGEMRLLFSRTAMVIGQVILAFPIIAGLTVSSVSGLDDRIRPTLLSLGASRGQGLLLFLSEARFGILAAVTAGFGRVFGEIGVSMMLGGNIQSYTRNIPTAVALETSKGNFAIAFALGIVLLVVALVINSVVMFLRSRTK